MLVTSGLMAVSAVLVALILPARGADAGSREDLSTEAPQKTTPAPM